MGIMIHGGTGAENHCIVIESSQTYPADLPAGGHSGMRAKRADPESSDDRCEIARCAIAGLRYARAAVSGRRRAPTAGAPPYAPIGASGNDSGNYAATRCAAMI